MKLFHALAFSAFAFVLTGCAGYHLGSNKPVHLAKVGKLAVPTFVNETLEPRLGVLMANALIKQLQVDGTYQVATKDKADASLECKIRRIQRSQSRSVHTNVLSTSELTVGVYVDYRMKEAGTGTALHSGRVYASSNIVLDPNWQLSEHQAMEEVAQRAANQIVMEIAEGW